MTTQQQQNYRTYRNRQDTPLDKLMRGFKTIGPDAAETLGLKLLSTYTRGNREMHRYNVEDDGKKLDLHPGLIWLDNVQAFSSKSSGEDNQGNSWQRSYGAFTGVAHVDVSDGHYTMRSSVPCVVIADRKVNTAQRNAFTEGISAMVGKHGKYLSNGLEINPTSVTLFESREKNAEGIPAFRMILIEAAGIFGEDSKGKPFYVSIRKFPVVAATETMDQEEAQDKPAPRSRPRRTAVTDDAPAGESANVEEGELAPVS